ncbi:hypothetical protein ACX80W_01725 [Arthrobacter sp. TMN-37]
MIQVVLELDLADYPSDNGRTFDYQKFHRSNFDQVSRLNPGAHIRLRVGRYSPWPMTDHTWMRSDLIWQITAKDAYALDEWQSTLEGTTLDQF